MYRCVCVNSKLLRPRVLRCACRVTILRVNQRQFRLRHANEISFEIAMLLSSYLLSVAFIRFYIEYIYDLWVFRKLIEGVVTFFYII